MIVLQIAAGVMLGGFGLVLLFALIGVAAEDSQ